MVLLCRGRIIVPPTVIGIVLSPLHSIISVVQVFPIPKEILILLLRMRKKIIGVKYSQVFSIAIVEVAT
jgi:hypothetical protein